MLASVVLTSALVLVAPASTAHASSPQMIAAAAVSAATATTTVTRSLGTGDSSGNLLISTDGVDYSAHFDGTLFDSTAVLVPQSSVTSQFSVRNATARPARLRVTLVGAEFSNPDLASSFAVAAAISTATPQPIPLADAGSCALVMDNVMLAPAESTQIVTVLTLGDLSGVDGQGERASMSFNLTLMDAAAAPVPTATCDVPDTNQNDVLVVPLVSSVNYPAGSGGGLATATGAGRNGLQPTGLVIDDALPMVMLASFLAGGGWFWFRFRRRRAHSDEADV